MKRSIAVVAAGRGLTMLWVFATAQVICQTLVDEDPEVYRAVSENKIGLVTQWINDKGLEKASRKFDITPLRVADMNPTADDDNDDVTITATATEEQKQHGCRRPHPRPRVPGHVVPEAHNTGTGVHGERPAEMSQAEDGLPVLRNIESSSTNSDGQEFGDYPRHSKPGSERPKNRRVKSPN